MSLKDELGKFDIDLEQVKEANDFIDRLQEAIDKMREHGYYGNLEVILNENLIQVKEKYNDVKTILGCKISYEQLEENISFIVKPCTEKIIKTSDDILKELGFEKYNGEYATRYVRDGVFIDFYIKDRKVDFFSDRSYDGITLGMDELQAIIKKCDELEWI